MRLFPIAAVILLSACGSSSDGGSGSSSESERLAGFQVMAKQALEGTLKDPDSAKYRNVHAYRVNNKDGQSVYVFCGEVNAKNAFGGYPGYERFVSMGTIAATEEGVSDFGQVWSQFCTGTDAGPIWW